ncbi:MULTISPECIES: GNAT family N-acetyltransferase [unclassified Microbacterium]|uniref:GNAT family N-acetyltransferase n=1 Tax=unclassified Microbacterium TaxID=2609290 RepID=UPI00214CB37F|nr:MULTISPECIES: GNAT family N-acetyltransferase [unclassified Microbacterium]MCR2809054.1 GNAT family N-acetyltransferase [Microbacterium sp. zg.B185]WIM20210.1 GNAT family N-acetyltransferase [Microbacterium sp. zg-B185]
MLPPNTPRLRFREMAPADLPAMAGLLGDADVMRFYPAPKTREQAASWIDWNLKNYVRDGHGLWIIETSDGEFVGDCGLTWQDVNGVKRLEIGYHVLPRRQGLGLATEAAAACRDFARDRLGAEEVIAIVHPDNRASIRVAEKIGMHREDEDRGNDGTVRRVLSMPLSPA